MGHEARRRYVPASSAWADMLGYSRAVRDGDHIWVSATAPVDIDGRLVGAGDAEAQAGHILSVIGAAVAELGSSMADVVRTRIYLRSFADLELVARAHRVAFPVNPPACTVIAVADLVLPEMRVYIEAEAKTAP